MNIELLKQAIKNSHSRTMTVDFIKANGEHRTMLCKTEVKRYLSKKPNKRVITNQNDNVVRVYDIESKSYKSFKLDSVTEFKCNRVILK